MKKVTEAIIRKDAAINKVQFDKEWFYSLEDMEDFLKEDLSGVESVSLPMEIYGETFTVKCATWEDIERFRHQEPLQDFKSSVFRDKKNLEKGK
ncbi:MAG: hypothetical protein V4581_18065 [Bacteroidota bacterium]